jgi:hypothetical protein
VQSTLSLGPRPRGRQINGDPRAEFLDSLAGSLGGGWLQRRRLVSELEHHLEDCVADLKQAGVAEDAAIRDAIARLGDVDAIVGAVRASRSTRSPFWRSVARVPIAWIAVGAMSIVTLAAAELPQASGAKVPAFHVAPATHVGVRQAGPSRHEHSRTSQPATSRVQLPRTCRCSQNVACGHWQS